MHNDESKVKEGMLLVRRKPHVLAAADIRRFPTGVIPLIVWLCHLDNKIKLKTEIRKRYPCSVF